MADDDVRFYVDADLMSVGIALARLRKDVTHAGHDRAEGITQETKDPIWLPLVGLAGWVVITKDRKIRRRAAEVVAVHNHAVKMVCITGNKNLNSWDRVRLLARHWDEIDDLHAMPGPWIHSLTDQGLRQVCPPWPTAVTGQPS